MLWFMAAVAFVAFCAIQGFFVWLARWIIDRQLLAMQLLTSLLIAVYFAYFLRQPGGAPIAVLLTAATTAVMFLSYHLAGKAQERRMLQIMRGAIEDLLPPRNPDD